MIGSPQPHRTHSPNLDPSVVAAGCPPCAVLLAEVKQGNVPAAEALLSSGAADPNVVDPATKETPLFYALAERQRQPQLLPLLLDGGADTNVRDASGATPLLLSIQQYDNETVTLLLK